MSTPDTRSDDVVETGLAAVSDERLQAFSRNATLIASLGILFLLFSSVIPEARGWVGALRIIVTALGFLLAVPAGLLLVGVQKEWKARHPNEPSSQDASDN